MDGMALGLTYAFVVFLELLEGGKLGRPAVVLALYVNGCAQDTWFKDQLEVVDRDGTLVLTIVPANCLNPLLMIWRRFENKSDPSCGYSKIK